MTLNDFLDALAPLPAEAALSFATSEGEIAGGYHVTEFKLARVESIDCGGRRSRFDEAYLQLLDGKGGERMAVGKFAAIAAKSRDAVPGLGEADLKVEFAHGNAGKSIFELGLPVGGPGGVTVALGGDAALCKPAQAAIEAQGSRCSWTPQRTSCC
ncbi:MAG: DUF6428 family protein [Pseudomonadota bacterium]